MDIRRGPKLPRVGTVTRSSGKRVLSLTSRSLFCSFSSHAPSDVGLDPSSVPVHCVASDTVLNIPRVCLLQGGLKTTTVPSS